MEIIEDPDWPGACRILLRKCLRTRACKCRGALQPLLLLAADYFSKMEGAQQLY